MSSRPLTRQELDERVFLALKEHGERHLPIGPGSFKELGIAEIRSLHAALQNPQRKKAKPKRPRCPLTPNNPSLGSNSTVKYKTKVYAYIHEMCGFETEYPGSIPIGVLEAIANYVDK